jgi:hypothetical protein
MPDSLVRLIHRSAEEASNRVKLMESAGYDVLYDALATNDAPKVLLSKVPDAYVIDLSQLPKLDREVGVFLSKQRATRHVPLIFAAGTREQVQEMK